MSKCEVFLTPHSDDETLAMVGAITNASRARHRTRMVLVTDNVPSLRQQAMFPMDLPTLLKNRMVEWRHALACLHIDEIEHWSIPDTWIKRELEDATDQIEERIEEMYRRVGPCHIHTVCGADDVHATVGCGSPSHIACAEGLKRFGLRHPEVRVSFHAVYVYSKPIADRAVCGSLTLNAVKLSVIARQRKCDAILCYKTVSGKLGYGYKSVPELFDAAQRDPYEYTYSLPRTLSESTNAHSP